MKGLSLRALSIESLARVLQQAGSALATVATFQADLSAGAPSNEDGTIDLIQFAAWLLLARSK